MLNDPMLIAEMIAEKREQQDAKWRAQMEDLKAREAWHEARRSAPVLEYRHPEPFADCPHPVCRGEVPVPR